MSSIVSLAVTLCVLVTVSPSALLRGKNLARIHMESRKTIYSSMNFRVRVPDENIPWDAPWEDYIPESFTTHNERNLNWSDMEVWSSHFKPNWNGQDDYGLDRRSFMGNYSVRYGYPLNPIGRTGLKGRGLLARWGPNRGVSVLITKWKMHFNRRQSRKVLDKNSKLPVLQFLAIRIRGSRRWSIPKAFTKLGKFDRNWMTEIFLSGVMKVSLDTIMAADSSQLMRFMELFSTGKEIYRGYIDDKRNTDNAWVENIVMHIHDETGVSGHLMKYNALREMVMEWLDVNQDSCMLMTEQNIDFLKNITKQKGAHW